MKMLADMLKDDKPKPSHGIYYKGAAALASEKHFTPQELNKMHMKGSGGIAARKPTIGVAASKTIQANGGSMRKNGFQGAIDNEDQMSRSFMSSSASNGMMSQDQQDRLKNLNRRPFSVKSNTSRPATS